MMSRYLLYPLFIFYLASCFRDPPSPPVTPAEITTKVLTENLTFPWEILWGSDNYIWVTERPGKISRVDPSNGNIIPLFTITDAVTTGEGGTLGMVLHPQFQSEPYVFVAYTYTKSAVYTEKVVRYTYGNGTLTSPMVIIDDIRAAGIHNGCRLVISKDNKLFITTGDASDQSTPQNRSVKNGKILRVNLDGSIPSDNPDPLSPVWSVGHRNPQGLVFVKDSLFSSEHGPDSDDEVNMIHKASNYGWPDVKGLCDAAEQSFCDANNVIEPLIKWTPTIAVCGLDYYNHNLLPQWNNSLLLCTLKGSKLVQLKLNDANTEITETVDFFLNQFGRLRDVCISPEGKVFICTSNGSNDKIIEVGKK
jgi:glucose/arabinose dehydrogenase